MSKSYGIGLIGAPGSGKSEVARAFDQLLVSEHYGYVWNPALQLISLDSAVAEHATYREDLRVFFRGLEAEKEFTAKRTSYISVGTLLEPLAHAAVNLETMGRGLVTQNNQMEIMKRQASLATLSMLFVENFQYQYQFLFRLPLVEEEGTLDGFYATRVDRAIQEILAGFNLLHRIQVLEGTPQEQAQTLYDTVKIHLARMEAGDATLPEYAPGVGDAAPKSAVILP